MIFPLICGLIFFVMASIVFFVCWCFPDKGEICAALIQGLFILGTGILALIAGHFAYQTAMRQTRLREQNEEKRRIAYRFMIKEVISNFIKKITPQIENKGSTTDGSGDGAGTDRWGDGSGDGAGTDGRYGRYTPEILFPIVRIPEPLTIKNWENLAMLEENELSSLINTLSLIEKNNLFAAFSKLEFQVESLKQSPEALALEEAAESEIIHGMNRKEFYLNANTIVSTLKDLHASLRESPVVS